MAHPVIAPEEVTVNPGLAVQLDCVATGGAAEIGAIFASAFPRVDAYLRAHGLQCIGAPRAVYTRFSAGETRFTLAIPCAPPTVPLREEDGVAVRELPGGRALRFEHHGPYDRLHATYHDITSWLIEHGYIENEAGWVRFTGMWEEYLSDPDVVPPAELVTRVYLPVE